MIIVLFSNTELTVAHSIYAKIQKKVNPPIKHKSINIYMLYNQGLLLLRQDLLIVVLSYGHTLGDFYRFIMLFFMVFQGSIVWFRYLKWNVHIVGITMFNVIINVIHAIPVINVIRVIVILGTRYLFYSCLNYICICITLYNKSYQILSTFLIIKSDS